MDGRRPDHRDDRGRRFARELIAGATDRVESWHSVSLGPARLRIGVRTEDWLAKFIRDAYLPRHSEEGPEFSLAVTRSGELAGLPPVEWARGWTESGLPVPVEVTDPYRVFLDRQVGAAYAFDRSTGEAAVWLRHERELDLRSFITPFRVLLSWMAGTMDGAIVHASGAVVDGCGMAFSGSSGSGKSTLALALGLAGHPLVSDDCLLLQRDTMHAVFARAKLDDQSAELVSPEPLALRSVPVTPRAKRYLDVRDLDEHFTRSARLHAWGFPVIGSRAGHYPLEGQRAFRMLASDSLREIFGGDVDDRLRMLRTMRRHPSHRLTLGASMSENIGVVRAVAASTLLPAEVP